MSKRRRRFSADFRFRGALEAANGQRTISELAGRGPSKPDGLWPALRSASGNGSCWKAANLPDEAETDAVEPELFGADELTAEEFEGAALEEMLDG